MECFSCRKGLRVKAGLLSLVFVCLSYVQSVAELSELEQERNRRVANRLLFFFDAEKKVITMKQWELFENQKDSVTYKVFSRILRERLEIAKKVQYLKKVKEPEKKDRYVFRSYEIQEAALKEIFLLGDDGLQVMLTSVSNAREGIRRGILKTLLKFKDERILRVYDEVIFRDNQGGSRYTSRSRQYVAEGAYQYINTDRGKRIFSKCLQDEDAGVRAATLSTINKIDKTHQSLIEKELQKLYKFEWDLVMKKVELFKVREDDVFIKGDEAGKSRTIHEIIDSKPQVLLHFVEALSAILQYTPQIIKNLNLDKAIISHQMVGKLFVEYNHALDESMRKMVFAQYIRDLKDVSIQYKILDSLKDENKELYQKDVSWVLSHTRDIVVLAKAIELTSRWKITSLKPVLSDIAAKHYRQSMRELAKKALAEL